MEPRMFLNLAVAQAVGLREVKGDKFGVELELEGRNIGLADVATRGWNRHHEPSLRGESVEYTTSGSKTLEETKTIVNDLFKKFKDNKVKINETYRTSTHVHLNFSDKPVKHMINFFTLFTLLEEVLQYYSGEDRKGNLFCMSSRDAEGIIGVLVRAVEKGELHVFAGDRFKYGACNLSSLCKFGTVEVRTMRGAMTAEQVNDWLDILNDMYVYACQKMQSPAELIKDLSFSGAEGLVRKIFSKKNYDELIKTFPKAVNLHYSLMEGARIIQVFAYNFEEEFLAKVEPPKLNKKNGEARLPVRIPHGPFQGEWYRVYRRDGITWNVSPEHGAAWWEDGVRCADCLRIRWSAAIGRFVETDALGIEWPLNWARHHDILDEGRRRDIVVEAEPDWDEDGEAVIDLDDDDEGDGF